MKRMLRWRIRRCIASLLVFAMTFPLGESLVARVLAPAATAAPARQSSVVVFEFQNKSKGGEGLAKAVTRQVRLVMDQSPAFDLVTYSTAAPHSPSIERAINEGQLQEQELAGVPEPATAVKIARVLGADYALLGEIDEDGYEFNAEQKRVALKAMVYLYPAAGAEPADTITPKEAFQVTGEGAGEATQGALDQRARTDLAKRIEAKLAHRPEKPSGSDRPHLNRRWLPWVLGGVAVAILAVAVLGGKDNKGPDSPGALSVTATRSGVRLAWPPSTAAESYRVYRAAVNALTGSSLPFQAIADVPAGVQQYDDTPAVAPNVRYAYQVAAISGGKEGSRIGGDRSMAPGEPSSVSDVQATVNLRSIQLSWAAGVEDFIKSYRVYRSTQMSDGYVKVADVQSPTRTYVDSGLSGGQTYFYKVSAVGETGQESNWQGMTALARSTDLRPSAPGGVTATATEGERRIVVSWRANAETDLQYYQVYRGLRRSRADMGAGSILWQKSGKSLRGRGGPWSLMAGADRISPSVTSIEDTSVEYNTTYYYVVKAVSAQGESPNSDEVFATPNRQPGLVQGVKAAAGDGRVTVTWSPLAEPDITGYNVYRQVADQPATRTKLTDSILTVLQYLDTQVTNDTGYQYFVTAVDSARWESPLSVPTAAMPTAPPDAPTNVRASAGDNKVTVVWDKNASANLASYRVYRSDASNLTPLLHATVPVTPVDPPTIMYVDESANNLITYYYQVTAVNTSGVESARSPSDVPVSATPSTPPAPPQNVQAIAGDRSVTVTWSPVTTLADGRQLSTVGRNLRGYRVYRTVANTKVRTLAADLLLSALQGQPKYEDRQAPTGVGLLYSVTSTMLDSSDGVLESDYGQPMIGGVVDPTPVVVIRRLAPPSNFAGLGGDQKITFTWSPSTDAAAQGYAIYGAQSQTGPYVRLVYADGVLSNQRILTPTDWSILVNDTRYWFKIATVDKLGVDGTLSTEIAAMPNPTPPTPVEVQASNLDPAGALLDMAVRVTWKAPVVTGSRPIYGYRVFRSLFPTGPFETVTATLDEERRLLSTLSFTDQFQTGSVTLPEANGQNFYYQVVTLMNYPNAGVVESLPNEPSAGPARVTNLPPGKVLNLVLTPSTSMIRVSWEPLKDPQGNPVPDLARYTISRREKTDTAGDTEQFFPVTADQTQYFDTDLTAGVVYVYRVQAVDFITTGPWSDTKEAQTTP